MDLLPVQVCSASPPLIAGKDQPAPLHPQQVYIGGQNESFKLHLLFYGTKRPQLFVIASLLNSAEDIFLF